MAKTLAELRTLVLEPVDMQAEDFVDEDEVNRYINEGIRAAEATIHNIYQDYFLAQSTISLVANQSEYALPSEIFASKIRMISYDDGVDRYELKRIKALPDILNIEDNDNTFSYLILNQAGGEPKIKLYPTPTTDETDVISIWYIRNATELESDADELDIPEFYMFVVLYARYECMKKELGNPLTGIVAQELQLTKEQMEESLKNRVPDNDSYLIPDVEFYDDFDEEGVE